jgi:hypothetical protein
LPEAEKNKKPGSFTETARFLQSEGFEQTTKNAADDRRHYCWQGN